MEKNYDFYGKKGQYISLTKRGRAFAGWRGFVGCCFSIFGEKVGMKVFEWLYLHT